MNTPQFSLLLRAAPAPAGGGMMQIVLMVGMVAVMYFLMIRPQAKRAKLQKKFASETNTGDHVVLTSGMHGRINRINEDGTIQVDIARGTFITVERSAISMELTQAHRKKQETATSVTVAN